LPFEVEDEEVLARGFGCLEAGDAEDEDEDEDEVEALRVLRSCREK